MKNNYLNIYNNLIKLTRNKKLYLKLEKNDTFSDRLIFLFLHLALFFKRFKSSIPSKNLGKQTCSTDSCLACSIRYMSFFQM